MAQQQDTTAIVLSGSIRQNRGGHPFVEIQVEENGGYTAAFAALKRVPAGYRNFRELVTVIVNGVEHQATGLGATFWETETTREMTRTSRGKPKWTETTTRVADSGRCYVYLAEPERPSYAAPAAAEFRGNDDEDTWAQPIRDRAATGRGIDA